MFVLREDQGPGRTIGGGSRGVHLRWVCKALRRGPRRGRAANSWRGADRSVDAPDGPISAARMVLAIVPHGGAEPKPLAVIVRALRGSRHSVERLDVAGEH